MKSWGRFVYEYRIWTYSTELFRTRSYKEAEKVLDKYRKECNLICIQCRCYECQPSGLPVVRMPDGSPQWTSWI